jgi:hypothetical protein
VDPLGKQPLRSADHSLGTMKLIPVLNAMKTYGGKTNVFFTSTLVGEWSASRSGRFTPGERATATHWLLGWVDPKAGLDDVEKKTLDATGTRTPTPRSSSPYQSLYRLSHPGSFGNHCYIYIYLCGSFRGVGNALNLASNCGIGNESEGTIHGPIEVLSQILPGGTEERHVILSHESPCLGQGLHQAPPGYKRRASAVSQPSSL